MAYLKNTLLCLLRLILFNKCLGFKYYILRDNVEWKTEYRKTLKIVERAKVGCCHNDNKRKQKN
jgi:hypothetical protein